MEWIKTEDRKPDLKGELLSGKLLVRIKEIGTEIAMYSAVNNKWRCGGVDFYNSDVTHWMPLPEKPKAI